MDIKRYKHVIWDWNGTLLDDVALTVEVMNRLLQKRNMPPLSMERYKEIFGFPVIEYYRRLGFDFAAEPFEQISTEFIRDYDDCCRLSTLYEHSEAVLKAFKCAGISQSILSAAHQDYLDRYVGYFGLNSYFDKLIGLNHIHATSKVDNGKKWIASLPFAPGEVLLIGDTVHDYEVSREIGCDCTLVASGHQSLKRLKTCNCTVFESLADISEMPSFFIGASAKSQRGTAGTKKAFHTDSF